MDERLSVVVVISGSGTNLQALIDATKSGDAFRIAGVISNRPQVLGLQRAETAGIPNQVVDHTEFDDREQFDAVLGDRIEAMRPQLIVLAGFMRILTPDFVARFAGRMINIHPSLLPEFQGLHTHRRALKAGVSEHGASVHFVTSELDGGPVIAQVRVSVEPDDTEDSLAARVLQQEHILLPQVVNWFADGRVALRQDRVWFDQQPISEPLRCN